MYVGSRMCTGTLMRCGSLSKVHSILLYDSWEASVNIGSTFELQFIFFCFMWEERWGRSTWIVKLVRV